MSRFLVGPELAAEAVLSPEEAVVARVEDDRPVEQAARAQEGHDLGDRPVERPGAPGVVAGGPG